MKKTLKYILITSIMMFIGMNNGLAADVAHMCRYYQSNNKELLVLTYTEGNAADSTSQLKDVRINKDNKYTGEKCPEFLMLQTNGVNTMYASTSKEKLENLASKYKISKNDYEIMSLYSIDGVDVSVKKIGDKGGSFVQVCKYNDFTFYVDHNSKHAWVESKNCYGYAAEYKAKYDWFSDGCPVNIYNGYTGGSECMFSLSSSFWTTSEKQILLEDSYKKHNSSDDSNNDITLCDDISNTTSLIKSAYKTLKYLIPVLIIVLSIVDFIKVVANGEDKEYKNAWNKFIKRIIIGIVIILVPVIIEMLIGLTGLFNNGEINEIFCIFK